MTIETEIINDIKLMLGNELVDIELNENHYQVALKLAVDRYKQLTEKVQSQSQLTISEVLLGTFSKPWIRLHAFAWAKTILSEGYSKFPNESLGNKAEKLKEEASLIFHGLELELQSHVF